MFDTKQMDSSQNNFNYNGGSPEKNDQEFIAQKLKGKIGQLFGNGGKARKVPDPYISNY